MITRHPFRVFLMACLILCLLAGILVFGNLTQVSGTLGEATRGTEGMQPAGETTHMVAQGRSGVAVDNPNPPTSPVRLIFIHHSTGGNWLADPNDDSPHGGLGRALMNNNYYVSATNYGWGPDEHRRPDRYPQLARMVHRPQQRSDPGRAVRRGRAERRRFRRLAAAGDRARPARTRSSCSSRASPTPTCTASRTIRPLAEPNDQTTPSPTPRPSTTSC